MTARTPALHSQRIWITDAGRRLLVQHERCSCDIKMMGMLFACPDCGTVYGFLKDQMKQASTKTFRYKPA